MRPEEPAHLYTFYEVQTFTAKLAAVAGEDALQLLYAIQSDLLSDPMRWPLVKGTGGTRKGRVALPGSEHGKSGGLRYLYLFTEHRGRIYLLHLYSKSNQSEIPAEQKKEIALLVKVLKQSP